MCLHCWNVGGVKISQSTSSCCHYGHGHNMYIENHSQSASSCLWGRSQFFFPTGDVIMTSQHAPPPLPPFNSVTKKIHCLDSTELCFIAVIKCNVYTPKKSCLMTKEYTFNLQRAFQRTVERTASSSTSSYK